MSCPPNSATTILVEEIVYSNVKTLDYVDVDTDFSDRDAVVQHLKELYGEDKVCQIINFSYSTPKVTIKDVAKVLGITYKKSEEISKYFSAETWEQCIEENPNIYDKYAEYSQLFDICSHLSGRIKTTSMHAGGVAVVDTCLDDYMAVKDNGTSAVVLQADKKMCELIGVVKFDALVVSSLDVIGNAVKYANITLDEINPNRKEFYTDELTYKLINDLNVCGLFQIESAGMQDLITRTHPHDVNGVRDLVALYRPDAMPFIDDYIKARFNGIDSIELAHPELATVLADTYGQMIYQESTMSVIRHFGHTSFGVADLVRRGIGKKDKDLVQQEATKLKQRILDAGYDEHTAETISGYIKEFGGYSFCKAHACEYGFYTLQTAYLKAHYPIPFFCALFNNVKDNTGKLNKYMTNAKEMGITITPPSVNKSDMDFSINGDKIVFGLSAINGLGEVVAKAIIEEREANGKFTSLEDLASRVKINKSQMVMLIKSGAVPCKDKSEMMNKYFRSLFEFKEFKELKGTSGMTLAKLKEVYGIDTKDKEERIRLYNKYKKQEYEAAQQAKYEKHMQEMSEKYMTDPQYWEFEALSLCINNNPFDGIYDLIKPFDEIEDGERGVVVGIISNIQRKKDKNGKAFGYINIYSTFGILEVLCWHSVFKEFTEVQKLIYKGSRVAILCKKKEGTAQAVQLKQYEAWRDEVLSSLQ